MTLLNEHTFRAITWGWCPSALWLTSSERSTPLLVAPPRSISFTATSPPVTLSIARCTTPAEPLRRDHFCRSATAKSLPELGGAVADMGLVARALTILSRLPQFHVLGTGSCDVAEVQHDAAFGRDTGIHLCALLELEEV